MRQDTRPDPEAVLTPKQTPKPNALADVKPWAGNRIPTLKEAIVLTPQTVPKVEASVPFKLDPRSKDLIRDRVDLKVLETTVQMQNRGL